jgi:micrococcal nuclease
MVRSSLILIIVCLFCVCTRQSVKEASPELVTACSHETTAFRCVKFVSNYDADTITVNIPGVPPLIGDRISVRIRGIDSAERRTKNACESASAEKARQMVHQILSSAKRIDLVNIGRDKYFRILADVEADGKSIATKLIETGLGVHYDGGKKQRTDWCKIPGAKNLAPQPLEK